MLVELLSLEKMPVGALEEAEMVGKVHRLVVDPEELKLIGFSLKTGGYFAKIYAVSMADVVDVDKNGIVISSKEALVEKNEIVRIADILGKKFSIIGLPVKTRLGEKIGRVENVVVDTASGDILRVYTASFAQRRVFERSQIEKITFLEVVVKKNKQEITDRAEETSPVVETGTA